MRVERIPIVALLGAPGTGAHELALALKQCIAPGTAEIAAWESPPEDAALVLLMGLDLSATALQRAAQQAADARLRAALIHSGRSFRVVYGHGAERVANASRAIKDIAAIADPPSKNDVLSSKSEVRRAWQCEKCSDPECEHRLFSALLKGAR